MGTDWVRVPRRRKIRPRLQAYTQGTRFVHVHRFMIGRHHGRNCGRNCDQNGDQTYCHARLCFAALYVRLFLLCAFICTGLTLVYIYGWPPLWRLPIFSFFNLIKMMMFNVCLIKVQKTYGKTINFIQVQKHKHNKCLHRYTISTRPLCRTTKTLNTKQNNNNS